MAEIELIDDTVVDDKDCTGAGLLFRCVINTYLSSHNSIEQRKSLRLLKRRSCQCKKCTWPIWDDFLSEELSYNDRLLDKLKNYKVYKLEITSSRDYESGCYEIDDVYFREVKDDSP